MLARELCQRAGSKAYIAGAIGRLGSEYVVGLKAVNCSNGNTLAEEQVTATSKEKVLDSLGGAASKLRTELGESLATVQKFDAPLEQATTFSLDALNAYDLALSTWDKKGDRDSLPIFKKAIELDPNFAMAYGALATINHNLGDSEGARENATKAYELRDRVTEAEREAIEARYYLYVTGDLEKAAEVYAVAVQNYPDSAGAYNHLANDEAELGRYQQSVGDLRKALLLDPSRASTYANLAVDLLALSQVEKASAVLAEADKRGLQTDILLQAHYWIAFLRNDEKEMERLVQRSSDLPGAQAILLSEQSNTAAYYGHFEKAREFSRAAENLMERDGNKEWAASYLVQGSRSRKRSRRVCPGSTIYFPGAEALARAGCRNAFRGRSSSDRKRQSGRSPLPRARQTVARGHNCSEILAARDSRTDRPATSATLESHR